VGWYEWLLFLHVLGAFLMVGALTFYWCLLVQQRTSRTAGRVTTFARITRPADVAIGAGMLMTLVFGIWLAIYVDGYELWDGWILASFVLWAIAGWAGGQAGRAFEADPVAGRAKGIRFHAITSIGLLLILILMIWKPGA
jgi:uncharacterized membrane protein